MDLLRTQGWQRPPALGERSARLSSGAKRALLALWGLLTFLLVGSLGLAHAPLPRPERRDPAVARAVAAHRAPGERGHFALHVLYSACSCSQRIVTHLLARGAHPALSEAVLLVGTGDDRAASLAARGFRVSILAADELGRRFHLRSAPLLLLAAPDHSLRYVGGYTERKQGAQILDQRLIRDALSGGEPSAVPVFGCAVSRELQRLLDPFGLKYSSPSGGT